MVRVALYTRVSTEDQAKEGFSLGAQLERLRHYAKAQGWAIAGEYVDEGQSGRTTKRPAYLAMMAEAAKWDTLLVMKMDRIHRNSKNFMQMMEDLTANGKGFASVTESLDTTTAMGRFVMDTIQRIAQLESEQIGERVTIGMTQKASTGQGSLGGPAPYGYQWKDGKLVFVDAEAFVVRQIFELAKQGFTSRFIAMRLLDMNYRTRQGKYWTYWNVKAILKNPVYKGKLVWDGILQSNTHEPIVAEA